MDDPSRGISEERLKADDKIVNFLMPIGLGWVAFAWYVWQLPWFWSESINGGPGSEWWSLLAIFLTSIAVAPLGVVWLTFNWRGKEVTKQWKEETGWLLLGGVSFASLWGALWLYCLPHAWGLWPFDLWWKWLILLSSLGWMGVLPLIGVIIEGYKKLRNPIYISDQVKEFGDRVLKNGMKGEDVRKLQELLNKHGASIGVDGSFGNQTQGAVKKFQTDNSLTIDGIVGPETEGVLKEDETKQKIAANILKESLANISGGIGSSAVDSAGFTSILDGLDIPDE